MWFLPHLSISQRRARLARPALEALEDRLTPATFTVTTTLDVVDDTDGKRSLREAINAANQRDNVLNPGGAADVIVLKAGVYKIALLGTEDVNASGDFDVTESVKIVGQGARFTAIESHNAIDTRERLFDVHAGDAIFKNLTLRKAGNFSIDGGAVRAVAANIQMTGCVVSDNFAQKGGGIHAANGNVTLINSTVSRNVAKEDGGGIEADSGDVTLTGSKIRRNQAGTKGGGIYAGSAILTNSTVSGNIALTRGGGIYAGSATLANSTVSGNSAGYDGGGIYAGSATLTNSTVSGNSVGFNGGGIYAETATLTNSTVSGNSAGTTGGGIYAEIATLTNSTVSGNSAMFGGGIYAETATLTNSTVSGNSARTDGGGLIVFTRATLTNSTVSGNSAGADGGGIYAREGTLVNVTITENSAHRGGGVFHDGSADFKVHNTIIAHNLVDATGTARDALGDFISQGHNLIGDNTGSTGFDVNGDIVGIVNDPRDPGLGPLANNGGPTMTHRLLKGSPAIDSGDNAVNLSTEQRGKGFRRIKDGDGNGSLRVDIGAFER